MSTSPISVECSMSANQCRNILSAYQIYVEHYANHHKSKSHYPFSPPLPFFLGKLLCGHSSAKHTRRETQPADKPAGGHVQNRRQRNVPAGVNTEARPKHQAPVGQQTNQGKQPHRHQFAELNL